MLLIECFYDNNSPPQTVNNYTNQKIMNIIHRHRRPNRKKKHALQICIFNNILMNRGRSSKRKRMGEKIRGIGFETVAGMGELHIIVETLSVRLFRKNLNASKPSEHPPQVEECLKV